VRAPVRTTGPEAVRGRPVFHARRGAVRGLDVTVGDRRFTARRADEGWEIDGEGASAGTAEALTNLVETLVDLRAVDAFRPRDGGTYGLDRPRGTIELVTIDGRRARLVLGGLNAAGSTVYARRDGDRRVLRVGIYLLSAVERVFYHRDLPPARARARRAADG
jgi:hypothetical protein